VIVVIIIIIVLVVVFVTQNKSSSNSNDDTEYGYLVDSGINYTEITDRILNPGRGFYRPLLLLLKHKKTERVSLSVIEYLSSNDGLMHLRLDLRDFSDGMGGISSELTEDALGALRDLFDGIREKGGMAIVRFSYDFDGTMIECEPGMELVQKHIEQLGEVMLPYSDVIAGIETGVWVVVVCG
jgi:hypothetical protein